MRILHIGKYWPPYAGGIERYTRDLAWAQAADGHDVGVVAHAASHAGAARMQDHGVQVELSACLGQWLYTPISPGFPGTLARAASRLNPQLVHLHMPNPSAFWALALPALRRVPWVLHWHSDIPLDHASRLMRAAHALYRPWETRLLKRAAAVIATSPQYRDASPALAPWRQKVDVIPLGIDALPAPPAAAAIEATSQLWRGDGLRLLAVGRLSHYKGYDVLLRALAQVPGVRLLLIGGGECERELRGLIDTLGMADRVNLAGALDDTRRDAATFAADAFCLPSIARSEAFGLVLLEAMRAGIACLASDIPGSGITHVLDGGRAGLLVPPGDPQALAQALTRLRDDAATRDTLAAAGHARWRNHFTMAASATAVEALYRRIVQA